MTSTWLDTVLGGVTLTADDHALVGVRFDATPAPSIRHPLLDAATAELLAFLRGDLRAFTVPLRTAGTPFQATVWAQVAAIPYGERRTYLEIAKALGSPGAARAVGAANGANPIPIFVPCHRVVGRDAIGGYLGGVNSKKRLLEIEGGRRIF